MSTRLNLIPDVHLDCKSVLLVFHTVVNITVGCYGQHALLLAGCLAHLQCYVMIAIKSRLTIRDQSSAKREKTECRHIVASGMLPNSSSLFISM